MNTSMVKRKLKWTDSGWKSPVFGGPPFGWHSSRHAPSNLWQPI